MSRLFLGVICIIAVSFLFVSERQVEGFADEKKGQIQSITGILNTLQYDKGRVIIGFYTLLLINRSRRLRAKGDTTLDKDIAAQLAAEMKERSRWTNFETWMKVCTTTQGTPMESNLIARTTSLPVDPMNYLRYMNTLVTLYREEFALLRDEKLKKPTYTRKEIDEGTAQEKYVKPAKVPKVVGDEMENYLIAHTEITDTIWPKIASIGETIGRQAIEMNELLNIKEKMPNGFSMRIYVDFEEKNFQKPLSDVLKYIIDKQAMTAQFDEEGKRIMSLEQAKISTTMEFVRLSRIDFTPWFVPIYRGKVDSYEDRFKRMIFLPSDYLQLGEICVKGLQEQLRIVRDSLAPVKKNENFVGQVEVDDLLFESFATKNTLPPEDQPLIPQLREVINKRFFILGQLDDTFKKQMTICQDAIKQLSKVEKDAAGGKLRPVLKNPFGDNEELPEMISLKKNSLPVGDAL